MVIGSRQRIATLAGNISLSVNGLTLQQVESTKCLGLTIDQFLTWRNHLQSVRQKVGCGIRILKRIRPFVGLEHLINVYRSIVEPYFTYCCIVWDSIGETLVDSLQKLQNRAARVITGYDYAISEEEIDFAINQLKLNKAPGCDKVLNEVLNTGKDIIIGHLLELLNRILSSGKYPTL